MSNLYAADGEGLSRQPLFDWCNSRASGILLHPTSLPAATGIGNIGGAARNWIDMLVECGMTHWQLCPLGPTGFGDSPYQTFSAFAANPYLVDWDPLLELGLIQKDELDPLRSLPRTRVAYGELYLRFWPLLRLAADRYLEKPGRAPAYFDFPEFCAENAAWLEPYCWFRALKDAYHGASWDVWPSRYQTYESARKAGLPKNCGDQDLLRERFFQYLLWQQWRETRSYASARGIGIIGDIPIYVAYDSADFWASPELFQINKETGRPRFLAGVPPDFFSADGQFWGNPLYDWNAMEKTGFAWWMERLSLTFSWYDIVRIDHFRAFYDYWRIPVRARSARRGSWQRGPGLPFFQKLKESFPDAKIIAEDLGELKPEVHALREATGLPGMAVLQFAFDDPSNAFLPHNHTQNLVVYTGTHDNDTTLGWYRSAPGENTDFFRRYLRVDGSEAGWDLIRAAFSSPAPLALIPVQDLLSLGSDGRFNTPGTDAGNWQWRCSQDQLNHLLSECAPYLRELNWLYQRQRLDPEDD